VHCQRVLLGVFHPYLWPLKAPGSTLGGGSPNLSSAFWRQYPHHRLWLKVLTPLHFENNSPHTAQTYVRGIDRMPIVESKWELKPVACKSLKPVWRLQNLSKNCNYYSLQALILISFLLLILIKIKFRKQSF